MSKTLITEGQRKQYKRFVEDAADKALVKTGLDKDGLQRVIENGDELQVAIVAKLKELSVSNEYADEEVQSSHTYPKDYTVKWVAEQAATLRLLFPELKDATFNDSITARPPLRNVGRFGIPRWDKIAPTYGEAVDKVFTTIKSKRTFYNYCEGKTGPEYLRQHAKTVKMFQKLGDEQKGHDILIVPCQFGLRHRGRSVRRARKVFEPNEFGLGAFAVGIMLLTHPERLMNYDDLWIDFAGDEFSLNADGDFSHAPFFRFIDGRVESGAGWYDVAIGGFGSASAWDWA